jgi:solute carrier family 50 protein (sugar transporter)
MFGVAALISCTLLLTATFTRKIATSVVGKLGVLLCMLMFASPLSTLKKVIETKSARSIPLPFTLACMLNCILWSVAGIWEMRDFNIYAPNFLGLSSAIAQLTLKLIYGDGEKSSLQLPL